MDSTQPTISSFFKNKSLTKRKRESPIDLTEDAEHSASGASSSKPTNLGSRSSPNASQLPPSLQQWSFTSQGVVRRCEDTLEDHAMKQKLHEAFKKKLLQGDESRSHKSLASSGRFTTSSGLIEGDEDEDDSIEYISPPSQQEIEQRPAKRRKHAPPKVGPSGQPYTPLELQVLKLKKENPGTILMVEVGYKYKFFGDDAKVARKELGMVAFVDRNFLVASIPTHRRDVHLKKLLSQGYRVGIVNQIETAALKKASDNRNAPFERRVTNLYTAATYVDNIDSVDDSERYMPPILMCLIEEPNRSGQCDVNIGLITVCPSTGDVVWDDISDTPMRIELETRLAHMRPAELLLPESGLSEPTAKLLTYLTNSPTADHKIRVEHLQHIFSSDRAFDLISDFYTEQRELHTSSSGAILAKVVDFPKRVTIALAHAIKYLSTFGIASALLETTFFERFTTRAQMLLTANTLTNLEIYRNETDYTINGSLLWVLDNTKTRFGARMLKHWVGRPLANKRILQERVEAVEEILESSSEMLHTLRDTLKGLPDLARGLCRIQYGQCTPQELATIFPAFRKVANAFQLVESPSEVGLKSVLLSNIIFSLPRIREPVIETLGAISLKKALEGEKEEMWTDPERYPAIDDAKMAIQHVEAELEEELKKARRQLRLPSLQWTSVAGDEYIIEVKRSDKRPIPDTWTLHSKTKYLERYRPLEVIQKLEERARYQETLQAEACNAYRQFLAEISSKHYTVLRAAVTHLAMADCLICFAHVALRNNYVRPEFMNEDVLEIVDGRHPMIEELRSDPFVPNSVKIGSESPRNLIITGPNMGGKSSCVRMVALIAIMAQIGSYVPAASLRMSLLDSVLTRMGASDDLAKGRSTFMVEMSETRDILYTATKKSLVILDELGRGTSTFDGMAIADAVLHHLVETTKCKTLFITHYPLVASSLERRFPKDVENLHMDYQVQHRIDGTRDVTFLYRLAAGIAPESFGVECGRLAGLPESVLSLATSQASTMQAEVTKRMRLNRMRKFASLVNHCLSPDPNSRPTMQEIKQILQSLQLSDGI